MMVFVIVCAVVVLWAAAMYLHGARAAVWVELFLGPLVIGVLFGALMFFWSSHG